MKPRVVAFVPLKRDSERVRGKNLCLLGGRPLYEYIFQTLARVPEIDGIFAFASDPVFKKHLPSKVKFLTRSRALDSPSIKGLHIYREFCAAVSADFYILAHATSPFLDPGSIRTSLRKVLSGRYDSALSVRPVRTFAWFQNRPLNYSPSDILRTQQLQPVVLETNGFFIFKRGLMAKGRRVGSRPYFHALSALEALDVDTPEDFKIARCLLPLYKSGKTHA
ncbi:MAG: hypothetical protein A2Z83_00935 [Omnitrophica bacterium GWA2_52_8]|nr:MAG: hypothetical protein A2Z83_00935 [Omnitrophica bacterium GWA2_52_8]